MKNLVLSCLVWLMATALFSQSPVLLRNAQYLGFEGVKVQMPNNTMMIFFNDTSAGNADVYVQKLSSEGAVLWPEARIVANSPREQRIISATATSDGNIMIVYSEYEYDLNSEWTKVQKISMAGQCLWTNGGIEVANNIWNNSRVALVANNVGGGYVALLNDNSINIKNYNATGINQWPENLAFVQTGLYQLSAVADGAGGIIAVSKQYGSGTFNGYSIRVNSEGDVVGAIPYIPQGPLVPQPFDLIRNSAGDFFLCNTTYTGIQIQKIDANANLLLPAIITIPLDNSSDNITYSKFVPTNDGGLYSVMVGSSNYGPSTLYLDRLDANAMQVWDTQQVFVTNYDVYAPDLSVNGANDAWLGWIENNYNGSYPESNIKAVRVSSTGSVAFSVLDIGIPNTEQRMPLLMAQANKAVMIWNGISDGKNSLRCQVINNSGTISLEPAGRTIHWVLSGYTELLSSQSLGSNFIFVYNDYRDNYRRKIYYQITNQAINPLLEANGRVLNLDSMLDENFKDCISLPNNHLAILYALYYGDDYGLYLQEISETGAKVYPDYGLLICANVQTDFSHAKLSYVDGDLLISWPEAMNGSLYGGISGQRIQNGQALWGVNGKNLIPGSANYVSTVAMKGNYLVFSHEDYANNIIAFRALKIDNNGNPAPAWPPIGLPLIETISGDYQFLGHTGLVGNNLVCYFSKYNDLGPVTCAQMLSPEGNRMWGTNGLLLEYNDEWLFYSVSDAVYGDATACVIKPDSQDYLALQFISPAGDLQFALPGLAIDYAWNTIQDAKLIKYANGAYSVFFVGWEDQIGRINHRYVSPDGVVADTEPLSITSSYNGYWNMATSEKNNIGVIAYTDNNQYYYYSRGDGIPINSLWACAVNAPSVSIDDQVANPVLLSSYNYPNPFNPSTTIHYGLKESLPVGVEIYNAKGQLVRTLVKEAKAAGEYDIVWNGTDNQGRSVASGIYLYKIHAGKYSHTNKMMLMK